MGSERDFRKKKKWIKFGGETTEMNAKQKKNIIIEGYNL
jgi:hypothetical protein